MKKLLTLTTLTAIVILMSCGGGKKADLSEKAKLLTSVSWKLDPNATLKGTTDKIEDTTTIKANIELKGDVKKIADFLAETVVFGVDTKDPSKLSYSRTVGEGLFSTQVLGYWEMTPDESGIILKEWDDQAQAEKAPVKYTIVELSAEKLVIQKEGDASPNIYFPKK